MNKNLAIVNQNSQLMLQKSKSLIAITNNILSHDDWMQRLWLWADENYIPDLTWHKFEDDEIYSWYGLSRDKNKLLACTTIDIRFEGLRNLPKEICNLNNLIEFNLVGNNLIELPPEIGKLINLTAFILPMNNLTKLPKEIGNLTNVYRFNLTSNNLIELPAEIGNLKNLRILGLGSNKLVDLPKEIGELYNLKELTLSKNYLTALPKEITNLTNLTYMSLDENSDLILTPDQKAWICELIKNGCDVIMNDRYENFYYEYELARRYKYLEEFNVGREVPITPELLDNDIPPRITEKLADGTLTFEEYLDEVSEYLYQEKFNYKEKFNDFVRKLYDRNEDLGKCFERNIMFDSYEDNKLVWKSTAEGEDKKMLITHWGLINMFVKDTFGFETIIINIAVSVE